MKQRVWLVPSKSFQKAWSPSQVREAISLGPIFHFRFLLLRASADSLVIAIGKCDLWKNEACRSTNRVCRCLSPALCFQWQKWLSIIHPCFFSPGARSSTFHRHLVEFYLIVPSRDSQWNSLLMERKGNVCSHGRQMREGEEGVLRVKGPPPQVASVWAERRTQGWENSGVSGLSIVLCVSWGLNFPTPSGSKVSAGTESADSRPY